MKRDANAGSSESTAENREHVENAEENRDALAAQARRTQATAPESTQAPIGQGSATGSAQDPDGAAAMQEVRDNRDALEAQNRRTAATKPDQVNMTGSDSDSTGNR